MVAFLEIICYSIVVGYGEHKVLPHVDIAQYNEAGGEVAEDPNHQEDGVDDSEGDEGLVVDMAATWRGDKN